MQQARNARAHDVNVLALVASAGGIEAVSTVLDELPEALDAAVIALIHQQPDREGDLVHILGRRSSLPVTVAEDGAGLQAGAVAVAPSGMHTLVAKGPTIVLIASGASPPRRPSADLLLTTLAITCGPRATAAVLSGRGHDGATGATAIHRFGGTVVASNEASSTYFSMPHATIERDSIIDHVVALEDIAGRLASIIASNARPA